MKFVCISKTGDLKIGKQYEGHRVGGQIQINDDLHNFEHFEFAPVPPDTLQGLIIKHVCEIDKEVGYVPETSNKVESEELRYIRVCEPGRTKAVLWKWWRVLMCKLFK